MLTPSRTQLAAQAANRQPNPVWPWVVGGAVAAIGVTAYACRPRQISQDSLLIGGVTYSRTINFRGCKIRAAGIHAAPLRYEVLVSAPGVSTRTRKFRNLEEAQAWNGEDLSKYYNNPGAPDAPSRNTMYFNPSRTQSAAQAAARRSNPAWPWIAGGAVAAASVGAYFCWPRQVSKDTVAVEGLSYSRTIDFKGCTSKVPYQVTISGEGVNITQSFTTLQEAQAWSAMDSSEEEPFVGPPEPPPPPPGTQANPHPQLAPSFSGRRVQRDDGKVPPTCPPGYVYDIALGVCKPGKVPPPPGLPPSGGKPFPLAGQPRPLPGVWGPGRRRRARRPSAFAAATGTQPNPLGNIMTPALYNYLWAPNMYPPAIYGAYGIPA